VEQLGKNRTKNSTPKEKVRVEGPNGNIRIRRKSVLLIRKGSVKKG